MIFNDYYTILGLEKDVLQTKIKKRYREYAKKYHPDKGGRLDHFKKIKEAYDMLGNVHKRKWYDQHNQEKQKEIVIEIYPENLVLGVPLKYTYIKKTLCKCLGDKDDCSFCEGTGLAKEEVDLSFRNMDQYVSGLIFSIEGAGDTNKYEETQDILVRMHCNNLENWKYDLGTHSYIYTYAIHDKDFEKEITDKGKLDVYISSIGNIELGLKDIENDSTVIQTKNHRLKIWLNIIITNPKKFIKNYIKF